MTACAMDGASDISTFSSLKEVLEPLLITKHMLASEGMLEDLVSACSISSRMLESCIALVTLGPNTRPMITQNMIKEAIPIKIGI